MMTLHVMQHALNQDSATSILPIGLIFGFGSVV